MLNKLVVPLICGAFVVLAANSTSEAKHRKVHPCDDWGAWTETKSCKNVTFCGNSGHKRTIVTLKRTRECRNGIRTQDKQRSYCGCP